MIYNNYTNFNHEDIIIYFTRIDTVGGIKMQFTGSWDTPPKTLLECTWDDFNHNDFNLFKYPSTDSLNVNSVNYYNVIKINGDTVANGNNRVNILYYQKQKGWLRFDNIDGEIWERTN
jgi:hypothetical protein